MSGSLKDAWYAVTTSETLKDTPLRRWLFGEPVVVYRDAGGSIAVLADNCPHRNAPLSLGMLVDGALQCTYHGFRFNGEGRCVHIPNMSGAPPEALSVRPYPAVERHGIVWVWPGEAAQADPARLPGWRYGEDPAYRTIWTEFVIDAPVEMVIDNLMDLTHVHFVHAFGVNLPVHNSAPMKVRKDGDQVHYTRDVEGARFLSDTGEARANSTYMEIGGSFLPPALVSTFGLTKSVETRELAAGPQRIILHGLTPETPNRTRYIYMRSWNLYLSEEDVAAAVAEDVGALEEDKGIIEATYRNKLDLGEAAQERLVAIDEAAVRARRIYERLSAGTIA